MDTKEIIEGNRLIAAFDGMKEQEDTDYGTSWSFDEKRWVTYSNDDLPYHREWDWLIPVAQKIKKFVVPEQKEAEDQYDLENQHCRLWDNILNGLCCLNMELFFIAIVKFIEWRNQNFKL